MGIPLWLIEKKAKELGLEKDSLGAYYVTRMQAKILEENYATRSNEELADALGISKSQVEHESFRLGLRKSKEFWSNIIITTEEQRLLKEWNDEYDHKLDGKSRGNFVLGKILAHLFPTYTLQPERPIGGLYIDWFIPDMKMGFEVQGSQHTEYNNFHFETKNDFKRAQSRDYDKSYLCEKSGISLVYLYHDEDLTISLVKEKINEVF
jgi:hypothetical protein